MARFIPFIVPELLLFKTVVSFTFTIAISTKVITMVFIIVRVFRLPSSFCPQFKLLLLSLRRALFTSAQSHGCVLIFSLNAKFSVKLMYFLSLNHF